MKKFVFIVVAALVLNLVPATLSFGHAVVLDQVRLSWQGDPKTTMTVTWRTQENQSAPKVQYGPTNAYGSEATGTSQSAVVDGYFYHTVELTGLTPGTQYHYRVSGEAGTWSEDLTFRTAPSGPVDFTFTAFGDNGIPANARPFSDTAKDLVLAQNPALHLIAGDLTYADGDRCDGNPCIKEHWEQWFTDMARFTKTVPTMPSIGNHERSGDVKFPSGELFYTRSFALPTQNGEQYYSFDYGDVHFVSLNSDDRSSLQAGRVQYEWLRADLAATAKKFKVVVFHHMAYASTSGHSVEERIQTNLSPLFDQYDVDLVITGHNHNYERTYPIRFGSFDNPVIATTERENYVNPDGTIYVVSGGGGQGLANFSGSQASYIATQCKCHEIMRVDVDDAGVLTVRVIGENNATVDQFTISKTSGGTSGGTTTSPSPTPAPTPTPTPAPTPAPAGSVPSMQTVRGVNFAVWWHDTLGTSNTRTSIDNLKATGANYVGFAPFWYQDNKTSTAIYRRDDKTATDASLRSAIQYAKSKGMKVALKPMVDSRDGTWRGQLAPSDTNAWFQSYRDFLLNYAQISKDEGVDYLIIGTEFTTLSGSSYTQKWRDLISAVRAVYFGPLTYAANWGKRSDGEYYKIEFWDALDSIGIDAYFPLATVNNPSVPDIVSAWTFINQGGPQNWFGDIKELRDRFNKPVIFTEIGALSCDGTAKKPWEYPCSAGLDLQEQADVYEGAMRFWKDVSWMQGYLFWRWDPNPNAGGTSNGDFMPQGKPAENVMKQFWLGSAPVAAPASSGLPSSGSSSSSGSGSSSGSSSSSGSASGSSSSGSASSSGGGSSGGSSSSSASSGGGTSGGSGSAPIPSSGSSSGGGGGGGIPTATGAAATARPMVVSRPPFAYGLPRMQLSIERNAAIDLKRELTRLFSGRIPIHARYWHIYVNAYLYGGYPPEVLARSLQLGGKVVHPSISWTAWRRSPDYTRYMSVSSL